MSAIFNRIEKNYRKLKPWSERNRFEAFRLYDRDIPDFPFIVDFYDFNIVIYDRSQAWIDSEKNHLPLVLEAIHRLFPENLKEVVLKKRQSQEGLQQYEKLSEKSFEFPIRENEFQFLVNLHDYLDTGLFLDHRPSRYKIFKVSKGKKLLNLFSYTGSVSVAAALGGAHVTSVDLSKTYIEWSKRNFELNQIPLNEHEFYQEDVLRFINRSELTHSYDLIFLDPPTFSNSKRMLEVLDTQRDHEKLIRTCMSLLKKNGILFFSTNKRKFRLEESLKSDFLIRETSGETVPQDFHDKQIHTSFEIREKLI
jgi:23S rRNA (cytosine1962-C5)-methyltransferase